MHSECYRDGLAILVILATRDMRDTVSVPPRISSKVKREYYDIKYDPTS
jgi:hypothetical protein